MAWCIINDSSSSNSASLHRVQLLLQICNLILPDSLTLSTAPPQTQVESQQWWWDLHWRRRSDSRRTARLPTVLREGKATAAMATRTAATITTAITAMNTAAAEARTDGRRRRAAEAHTAATAATSMHTINSNSSRRRPQCHTQPRVVKTISCRTADRQTTCTARWEKQAAAAR